MLPLVQTTTRQSFKGCKALDLSALNAKNDCGNSSPHDFKCIAKCKNGYKQTKKSDPSYRCINGKWVNGDIICRQQGCGALEFEGATVTDGTSNEGDTRIVFCSPGYEGASAQYRCDSTKWTAVRDEISCTKSDCGTLTVGEGGKVTTCKSTVVGSKCESKCRNGYMKDRSVDGNNGNFRCNANGEWEGTLVCVPTFCPVELDLSEDNAEVSLGSGPYSFGATVTATCVEGWKGDDAEFTCDGDGNWVGSIDCVKRSCGKFVGVRNGQAAGSCRTTKTGDTCNLSCNPGYELVEGTSRRFVCGVSGEWEGDGACRRVSCPQIIDDDRVTGFCSNTKFGDVCTTSCAHGSTARGGSTEYTCSESGEWVGDLECKRVSCGPLPLPENGESGCKNDRFGDKCVGKCKDGYNRIGANDYTCTVDGWKGGCFECTKWKPYGDSLYYYSRDFGKK